MAKGLLRVTGKLDVTQFWPTGNSDADTVNVQVTDQSFEFSPDSKPKNFKVTKVFQGATLKGKAGKPKPVIHKGTVVTIRLQGVDAPELHFPPGLRGKNLQGNNKRYRQFLGETSTVQLGGFVRQFGAKTISCQVVTSVDKPNDVFDMYGRLIGDVLLAKGKKPTNINLWLAQNGWAFPTYYNSMGASEINALRKATTAARKAGRGIWPHFTRNTAEANLAIVVRPKGPPNPKADIGRVQLPKMYRRKIRHLVGRLNNQFDPDFSKYLGTLRDPSVNVADLLKNPKIKPKDQSLGGLVDQHGIFKKEPGDLVFFERPSSLLNATGKPIKTWW